jgi:signal transduction histidine kinase
MSSFSRLRSHLHLTIPESLLRLAALTIAVCIAATATDAAAVRRLPIDPARLRYVFRNASDAGPAPRAVLAADFDGDGVDEQVRFTQSVSGPSYIDVAKVAESQRFALLTINILTRGALSGIWDVTGDGIPELVWFEEDPDRLGIQVHVTEVAVSDSGTARRDLGGIRLAYEPQIAATPGLATDVLLLAAFDLDHNGTRESLVGLVVTGLGESPRGLWLMNWETGTIGWRLPTAGTPTGGRAVADVDGDGEDEMVVGIESPGNGAVAGDWDDGHGYVIAVEEDGRVLWWREIGATSCEVSLAVGDLDGDGRPEVTTGVGGHSEEDLATFRAAVWAGADGTLLAELPVGVPVTAVALVQCREGARLFVAASNGRVVRLRLEGGRLIAEDEIDCREGVGSVAAVRFEPGVGGTSLVAQLTSGSAVALNEHLRPVALLRLDDGPNRLPLGPIQPARFRVGGETVAGMHYVAMREHRCLYLARNPLPFWLRVLLVLAAAFGTIGGVPGLRRGSLGLLRRLLIPRASRDAALDELLSKLATASHGKLAATATFRRLREQLAMLSLYEGAPPEAFRQRFREAVDDARDIGLPTVREIGHAAARLGLSVHAPSRLRGHLTRIAGLVEALSDDVAGGRDAAKYQELMDSALPHVTEELEVVRRAAERERSAPAVNELERAVRARGAEIESAKIEVTLEVAPELSDIRVVGTAQELSFVFENLIANAVRAMESAPRRRLAVRAVREGDLVVVAVGDTGKGIAPERQEELFRPGVSERSGGGHGLAGSRDILTKRGGTIRLVRSAPGEGSVFEVRLKTVAQTG